MINPNNTYKTKSGLEVKIISVGTGPEYPVVGMVKSGLYWDPHNWTLEGKFLKGKNDNYDLILQNKG